MNHKKSMKVLCIIISMIISILLSVCSDSMINVSAESDSQKSVSNASKGLDIILVVDNSRRTWGSQKERNDAITAALNIAVGTDIRVGCVYFADKVYKNYTLRHIKDKEDYNNTFIKYLNMTDKDIYNEDANIGEGLKEAVKLFDNHDNDRKKAVILFSNGANYTNSGDEGYKKNADDLTEKQVRSLKQNGIDLYCISSGKNEDTAYLKRLVNYFDGNSLNERHVYVDSSSLYELYDEFTKMFYSIRGDVKYVCTKLDSGSSYSFTIPSLAISRLQIYTRGENHSPRLQDPDLNVLTSKSTDTWCYGRSTFLTVQNPKSGSWLLNVVSGKRKEIKNITVIAAYYTDMSASVRINKLSESSIMKGHKVRLECNFYDGNGEQIDIDPKSVVSAKFHINKPDGSTVTKELDMSLKNGVFSSNDISIEDTGNISADLNVCYSDNINMDYHFDLEEKITAQAPIAVKKYNNNSIEAEKITDIKGTRYQFRIPLEQYIMDKDSALSLLKVAGIHQYNDKNKINAYIENERLIIEAENCYSVNASIDIEDNDGLTTKFEIEGSIRDMDTENFMRKFIIGFVLLVIVGAVIIWIIYIINKKEKEEKLREIEKELSDLLLYSPLNLLQEYGSKLLNTDPKAIWNQKCEEQEVPETLREKIWEDISYSALDEQTVDPETVKSEITKFDKNVEAYNTELSSLKSKANEMKEKFEEMKEKNASLQVLKDFLISLKQIKKDNKGVETYQNDAQNIENARKQIDANVNAAEEISDNIINMLDSVMSNKIKCKITIKLKEKNTTFFSNSTDKWFCCLDDFKKYGSSVKYSDLNSPSGVYLIGHKITEQTEKPDHTIISQTFDCVLVIDGNNRSVIKVGETEEITSSLGEMKITSKM